jgi:hypothetical protein
MNIILNHSELKSKTKWRKLGFKLNNPMCNPIETRTVYYMFGKSKYTCPLYSVDQVKKRKVHAAVTIPDSITLDMVLRSLYEVNKVAKTYGGNLNLLSDVVAKVIKQVELMAKVDQEYALRDNVLDILRPFANISTHFVESNKRIYVKNGLFRDNWSGENYWDKWNGWENNDDKCNKKLSCDEFGGLYYSSESLLYDIFECYTFDNGYSFRRPIAWKSPVKPQGATELKKGFAIRRKVKNIRLSRAILKYIIANPNCIVSNQQEFAE